MIGIADGDLDTHEKEARALRQIKLAVREDGRLCFRKSAEGARLDFGVHLPGDEEHALGVQLKTSSIKEYAAPYYLFNKTNGYDGAALVCMSVDPSAPRVWVMAGSSVTMRSLSIAVTPVRKNSRRSFTPVEIDLALLPQHLLLVLCGNSPEYKRGPITAIESPTSPSRLKEYLAFKLLQQRLPLLFIEPEVEARHYDYLVDGCKWQLKSALARVEQQCYHVVLGKSGGWRNGQRCKRQYGAQDFDFLCIQLPENIPTAYLIPMTILTTRGLAGGSKGAANILVYPLRTPRPGANWATEFAVDLRSPVVALSGYERVRRSTAKLLENS